MSRWHIGWGLIMRYLFASVAIMGAVIPFNSLAAPEAPLAALGSIEPGFWELRSRGDQSENRSMCVSDPAALLNLQHEGAPCSRFIIYNAQRMATVQYSCAGAGNHRTTLRVETPRLVQIESQGIRNREPFSVQLEGRRLGVCGAAKVGARR